MLNVFFDIATILQQKCVCKVFFKEFFEINSDLAHVVLENDEEIRKSA